ncbi:MAG: hypothetical protein ABSE73_09260 [Planctomycetota bacterium]
MRTQDPKAHRTARLLLGCGLLLAALAAHAAEPAAPAQQQGPAILFAGYPHAHCGHDIAARLQKDGFAVNALGGPGLEGSPLTWERVKKYNVIVVAGLGLSNADFSLTDKNKTNIAVLRQFIAAGGGVFCVPIWMQMDTLLPPQEEFLKPLGLVPLFRDVVFDPESSVRATAWKLDFAHTTALAKDSPLTQGATSLWYPVATRAGGQQHTTTFKMDENWTVPVRGEPTSLSREIAFDKWCNLDEAQKGAYDHDVPLLACRQAGKGRVVCFAITPEYLFSSVAATTLEDIVLSRGLRGTPSHGYALIRNALRWLAEPSRAEGALGGAAMDAGLLKDPAKTQFGKPQDWEANIKLPEPDPACAGLIGARTAYSSGKGTIDEWAAKAREQQLSFVVFLEEFAGLTKEKFDKLKSDCARNTSAAFAAIPGFTIDDEVGNHYFFFGTAFPYPDKKLLSDDGKVLVSYDAELNPKNPRLKGQLAMTTLTYAYSTASFKLTAGNYLFGKSAAPFAHFYSNWDACAVIACQAGTLLEDATQPYLKLVAAGQGPLPLALSFCDDPAQLAAANWRTVVRMPKTADTVSVVGGQLEGASKLGAYFNTWHFYPDNPTRIYVTSGPEIERWSQAGPRDYEGNNQGDFVRQGLRWNVYGKVKSEAGLRSVTIYDGPGLFRRFLPQGQKAFEFALQLTHDKQHNLVLVAEDAHGARAISGEQWDRNHRLEEFNCSDRNNQLSYGYLTSKDGYGLMLGGNQRLATPNKRLDGREISPSGTFKNDSLLGAPAFDGAAGGEPAFFAPMNLLAKEKELVCPSVCEATRLLHTGDVHIGEGRYEHNFTDGIQVANVWHTLWKTEPAQDFSVVWRQHFLNVDPDSPLAVFLWTLRIKLLRDIPNNGVFAGFVRGSEARLWLLRGGDGRSYAGTYEDTAKSSRRTLTVPFGPGTCAAALDSPLGGTAVFPMSAGMEATLTLPTRESHNLAFALPAAVTPQKAGEEAEVAFLLVGIPRATERTKNLPAPTTEIVERFRSDFGMSGERPAYTVDCAAGSVSGQHYILDVDGKSGSCFSGTLKGDLISSLPIRVSSLNDRWSAYLLDRGQKKARPVGVFENKAWAVVCLKGNLDVFVGHPVVCDKPELFIQVAQTGENAWAVEVHNPTDAAVRTTLKRNPHFDPLKDKTFNEETIELPAGQSVFKTL